MVEAVGTSGGLNELVNQAVNTSQRVLQAIQRASTKAGVDFAYMLNKASQESSLNPKAKASTSSATGLFQFVEQTWLRTVKSYGAKYGLEAAAEKISVGSDGVARVADSKTKKAILDLRSDPEASASMAAELTNANKASLQSEVGGKIGSTELYLAHFLGAGGASDFLSAMRANPNAEAASVLPEAAAANTSVFYDKSGQPRSLSEIYQRFAQKFEKTPDVSSVAVADAAPTKSAKTLPSLTTIASIESVPVTGVTGSYVPSVMNNLGIGADSSSPFAAMT
ncbi:MAG: lytic transglycosylase domain-containing protein [Alphaproteobacteria bacterium]|nr:lytic transglycosylase domain-containing protein [Alphaproteobacteria bacterium]